MRAFLVLFLVSMSFNAQAAVETTSPFKNIDEVTENLAQEFYRSWRLRVSELPQNYKQVAGPAGVQYQSQNLSGCAKTNASSLFQPVAEITFTSRLNPAATELDERIALRGCAGQILLTEIIRVKGTDLAQTPIEDVLAGKLRFVRGENERSRTTVFVDAILGPLITVLSEQADNGDRSARFVIQNRPLISIRTQARQDVEKTRIDLEDWNVNLSRFGSRLRSWSSGLRSSYTVFKRDGSLYFRLNDDREFTTQRQFETSYSEMVVFAANMTAAEILKAYLAQVPKTEVARPSAGANQRILDELNQALNRVTSNRELERVRLLIQEYILAIQNGELAIDDKRTIQ